MKYYLYYLRRPDKIDPFDSTKGQPFYVGNGFYDRHLHHRWEALRLKHKPGQKSSKIMIIHELWQKGLDFQEDLYLNELSKEDAIALEIAAIEQYGRIDLGTGCLSNLTNGGIGLNGYVNSTETKNKRGKSISKTKTEKFIKIRREVNIIMDITQLLTKPARKKLASNSTPHPLKKFFRSREISQISICAFLKNQIHQSQLSEWLSGVTVMPEDIEEKLQQIANEILKKEKSKKN